MSATVEKAYEKCGKLFDQIDQEIYESVEVTGIALSGDKNNREVIITGKRRIHHTGGAMNSPKMAFDGEVFGFESKVAELCEKIIEEAKLYALEDKSSQEKIPFEKAS